MGDAEITILQPMPGWEAAGPIRRWQIGDVVFRENNFIRIAYVYTTDPKKVGTIGIHRQRVVEFTDKRL